MAAPARAKSSEPEVDLEGAVHELPTKYIQCRDFAHSWKGHDARRVESTEGRRRFAFYEVILRCTRCDTKRLRRISPDGHIMGSSYEYADNYLLKGVGRMTSDDRAVVRLESTLRLIQGGKDHA